MKSDKKRYWACVHCDLLRKMTEPVSKTCPRCHIKNSLKRATDDA